MMTLPDFNEAIKPLNGSLFPFGWVKLLRWLHKPKCRTMRVPLMVVVQKLQASRLASQLAFMMIEYISRSAIESYGETRSEIGWVLADNKAMNAIAASRGRKAKKDYKIH